MFQMSRGLSRQSSIGRGNLAHLSQIAAPPHKSTSRSILVIMQASSPSPTPSTPIVARSHNVTPPPATESSSSTLDDYDRLDVLCGRQSFVLRHEGNRNYSRVVRSFSAQYKA